MIEKSDGRLTYLWIVKFRIKITMMMDRADTRHGTRTKTTLRWPMLRCLLASWTNIQQADKGSGWLDDSFKTVCRVRECDTADECGCGDDGDGDGGDDGVSVNISHTPHSTFSRHPDTALWKFLGGQKIMEYDLLLIAVRWFKICAVFFVFYRILWRLKIYYFLGYKNVTGISIVHCSGLTGLGLVLKYLVRKPRPRPRALRAETMIMIMIDIHIQLEID